jgi:phasin family protein
MSTLTEQFSAVRKSQVEAQINFFQNFAAKAVESAQKIAALNLTVSRASMEKSSAAMAELLEAKDPRDLFALTKRTQETIDGLLAYNRELLAIATGASAALTQTAVEASPKVNTPQPKLPVAELVAPPAAPVVVAPAQETKAKAIVKAVEPKPVVVKAVEAKAVEAKPVVVKPVETKAVEAKPVVVKPVEAKPVVVKAIEAKPVASKPVEAKAVQPKPVAAKAVEPKPVAAPAVTKPVEAAAPAPVSAKPAAAQQQLDLPATKAKKKK